MPKDGFTRNPYPDLNVTEQQREQLIELVNGCVQNHFQKYEQFFVTDQHYVDERRWEHVKSKDDLHVYNERSQKDQARKGLISTSPIQLSEHEKDMAVMISVGTVVGDLEDLMFGIINTTWDAMRIKAATEDQAYAPHANYSELHSYCDELRALWSAEKSGVDAATPARWL
ncbi:hypothetical protein PI125_g24188 [Phytophthora idaei]|nr:hypothetical protein PI125_g24188 [Phytophthora idaei]KAG3126632.1 hypothetical protein PI126_g22236 [Phytophthora idaei]